MKTRFSTYDIICSVAELQRLVGLRVNQVYDIDNKTYLIRLQDKNAKAVLLLESGSRFHTTQFEWPKNVAPNGFTMKLRKHLKNKRLEHFVQMGTDRIIDMQFGTGEAAYHVILELYDKGNILLTDYEMTILNILRPHVEGEEVRFAVREKYPESRAKENQTQISESDLRIVLKGSKPGDNLKKVLNPILPFGPALIDHVLSKYDLIGIKIPSDGKTDENTNVDGNKKKGNKHKQHYEDSLPKRDLDLENDLPKIKVALEEGFNMIEVASQQRSKGFIIQRRELKPDQQGEEEEYFIHNLEYHPYLYAQDVNRPYKEFDSFDLAVDEFYSKLEAQKIDVRTMQQERDALKKLSNVKKDHEKRLMDLTKTQIIDKHRAELITRNQELVDGAIFAIRSAIANQMSWPDIESWVKAAQKSGDEIAKSIKDLKLERNHISLLLNDPYDYSNDEDDEVNEHVSEEKLQSMMVDINLGLSAYSNATRYYDQKRNAEKKEQRTIESSAKALKSAERKTQQTLKDVRTISTISKARKVYWFEKFYWFISTENYLVIGGRDQQQNELIVKRYMRPTDIYVHAEIQGASSVVIRNPSGEDVPPKTLLEAGTMAISYSVAWDAKVVTNAYWVKSQQVSKTAPTGEYLGTGSFMIRGKKNFLPPCHLVLGMSFLFKLEDGSIARHIGERRVRTFDEEQDEGTTRSNSVTESEILDDIPEDPEIALDDSDNEEKPAKEIVGNSMEDGNSSSDDDEGDVKFPNTHVKIQHDTGKVILKSDPKIERLISESEDKRKSISQDDDEAFIIHAAAQRVKQNKQQKNDKRKGKQPVQKECNDKENESKNSQKPNTRRQKYKLKKIKEKYKDQDDEEKEIRMAILKSAGTSKEEKKAIVNPVVEVTVEEKKTIQKNVHVKQDIEQSEEIDDLVDTAITDVDMLDSLTGCPVVEDELLFAVPIIAPYQTLQNYKFKVKLTPGGGRRGKVAKTAISLFMNDKSCSSREKDLLKGVKDETIARNIPGKVKLSAPHMHKHKK